MKSLRNFSGLIFPIFLFSLLVHLQSCKKHIPPYGEIKIDSITNITHSSAVVYVNATYDPVVTLLGIHYSKTADFANYDSIYSSYDIYGLAGLSMQTKYYVKAWISLQDPTNGNTITRYSKPQEFLTKSTTSFTDPRDGQTYQTVAIGSLEWLAENLNYRTPSGSYEPKYYENNRKRIGLFYSSAGIANAIPSGWRLPTLDEVNALVNYSTNPAIGLKALFAPRPFTGSGQPFQNILGLGIQFPMYIPNGANFIYDSNWAPFYFMNSNTNNPEVYFFSLTGELFEDQILANIRCVKEIND
jgi:uncharacterized protein (TIGR02145 family)